MNDKARFVVICLLAIGFLPATLIFVLAGWLLDDKSLYDAFINLYRKAWRNNV